MKPACFILLFASLLALSSCETYPEDLGPDGVATAPVYDYDSDTAPVAIGSYVPGPGENGSYPSYQPTQASYTPPAQETYTPPSYGGAPAQYAGAEPASYSPPAASAGSYTVNRGDTLYAISRRHNTSVDAIKSANGLIDDLIKPGDVLNIP